MSTKKSPLPSIVGGAVVVLAILGFLFWAFHGSITTVGRELAASATWKVLILGAVIAVILMVLHFATDKRAYAAVAGTLGTLLLLGSIPGAITGGFARQTAMLATVQTVNGQQPEYKWRLPWSVASASARNRAGDVVGDFDAADTTYLPATNTYATPVIHRGGVVNGLDQVVIQKADSSTASVCTFKAQSPVPSGGWYKYNLRRALSFVSTSLNENPGDAWAYCDGNTAKLVIPVTRYAGFPEAHQVPAGVVIFDGQAATWVKDVKSGTLPGPVYPTSLAAAQRESTVAADGWWAQAVTKKAGYETVDGAPDSPDTGNLSELLLARADGSGWDYVTALTPRGASVSVVAVATIAADHVTDGQLNPLTIHKLAGTREGNVALANRVQTAFPELNWKANNLALVEVLPLSDGTWVATIANQTSATRRIEVKADRTLCLADLAGVVNRCVDANGATQTASGEGGATSSNGATGTVPASVSALSDADLLALQEQVTAELGKRLQATSASSPAPSTSATK